MEENILYSPFNLKIDNMEHLFLIGFEKDPDEVYVGFEPQYFEDEVNGTGLRVIAWRKDGYVDVYQQPSLLENKNFDVAGKGLADLLKRPMDQFRFNITDKGIDVYFEFEDKMGRRVQVIIKENSKKSSRPFDLLAPVGSSSESPSALPLFFLFSFNFVRRARTKVHIKINERLHKADKFPMPLNGARIYFMRYSKEPFLVNWNQAQEGELNKIDLTQEVKVDNQGIVYDLVKKNGVYEIERMRGANNKHTIEIVFQPPIPDVRVISSENLIKGRFYIVPDPSVGTLEGDYSIHKEHNKVEVKIHPSGGWQHNEKQRSIRFIYKVAATFRNWPKTYLWRAIINLKENNPPTIDSAWERK